MEVNSEVKHHQFSWQKPGRWGLAQILAANHTGLFFTGEPTLFLFHRISPERAGDVVLRAEVERTDAGCANYGGYFS